MQKGTQVDILYPERLGGHTERENPPAWVLTFISFTLNHEYMGEKSNFVND